MKIHKVGQGLPCLRHLNIRAVETYGKTTGARSFDDYGDINIGSLCPVNYPDGGADANQFTASIYYRNPPNQVGSAAAIAANESGRTDLIQFEHGFVGPPF
jgi:hypothetical protein